MGLKVPVKFGDSRSNRSRDIQLPHCVTNNDDNDQRTDPPCGALPKNEFKFIFIKQNWWNWQLNVFRKGAFFLPHFKPKFN